MISIVLKLNGSEWRIYRSIEHVRHKSRTCYGLQIIIAATVDPSQDGKRMKCNRRGFQRRCHSSRHPHEHGHAAILRHFSSWHTIVWFGVLGATNVRIKKNGFFINTHHQWRAAILRCQFHADRIRLALTIPRKLRSKLWCENSMHWLCDAHRPCIRFGQFLHTNFFFLFFHMKHVFEWQRINAERKANKMRDLCLKRVSTLAKHFSWSMLMRWQTRLQFIRYSFTHQPHAIE